jgi:periplasmic protein TonB
MYGRQETLPEVFTLGEVARTAGVSRSEAYQLVRSGTVRTIDGRFLTAREAIRAVRQLSGTPVQADRTLFRSESGMERHPGVPLALSGTLHVLVAVTLALVTTIGLSRPDAMITRDRPALRLVFLPLPGPGGGGGGGGRKEPAPPPAEELKGVSTLRSPVPVRKPPPPVDPPPVMKASEPPPVKAEPLPPIVAPVAITAADIRDRVGVPVDMSRPADSHGPGTNGGAGRGQGVGLGDGAGPGIGPGSGGGTGGGPYRPGSGITPPSVLREVRPDYTEEGRRRNLEGDVLLEIVVRRDGAVSDVRLLKGLGGGLDQRAIDAVRQWRFSPARRQGTPVDVIVEVAVEFKLR